MADRRMRPPVQTLIAAFAVLAGYGFWTADFRIAGAGIGGLVLIRLTLFKAAHHDADDD